MKDLILFFQIFVAVLLITSILMQSKGSGLGMAFGDSSQQYRSKRGVERLLHRATYVLAALFLLTSIVNLLLN